MSRQVALLMAAQVAALWLLAGAPLLAQENPQLKKRGETTTPQAVDKDGLPPEEDKSIAVPVYGFNPLQAQKEIRTGNYYFKKGSFRAAAGRFEEATKWNSGEPEAWLRLGEAQEKLKDHKAARTAYTKYLELAGDSKIADEIRKKLEKLK
jgi:tetratricopeptide (TPR) repeat protein